MGEQAEYGRIMREHRQGKHQEWNRNNTRIIGASGIPYMDRGETFCFREEGKPKVDFYPSTGRWRVVGTQEQRKAKSGGARKFLNWYGRQT